MPTLTFTTSGSWQALASAVSCTCQGEGGAGGAASAVVDHHHGGGGGGGGGCGGEPALALTIGTTYPFTIGPGGTGTNTVFAGDTVTVTGNAGASVGSGVQTGGNGGPVSSNTVAYAGGLGASGVTGSSGNGGGGGGGAGSGGTGGAGNGLDGGAGGTGSPGGGAGGDGSGADGDNGTSPGGGGGGGGAPDGTGGSGAGGQIVITYTASVSGAAALSGAGTLSAQGIILGQSNTIPEIRPGPAWLRHFARYRHIPPAVIPPVLVPGAAALGGAGTLTALGTAPLPAGAVVNQWGSGYGQGTTFTSITSALQSCVIPLTPQYAVGPGSGTPTPGNWLFAIASWTQDPAITNVHIGVGDDVHSWWREFPASGSGGNVRTSVSYTPNIARTIGYVYAAPDMEVAAIDVTVIEVANLGPWDTVVGTGTGYTPSGTSVSMSLGAPSGQAFYVGAVGGNNVTSGQAFSPSGWTGLATMTQTNGVNTLADNILTSAYLPLSTSAQNVSGSSSAAETLSGFLIGVLCSGNSPIPAGSNPNWPYVVFEAGFGKGFNDPDSEITWTDISSRLWSFEETTGIQYQLGQLQSSNVTLHLDDLDGYLMPDNTASPYYPGCQPGTPVRIRAALGTMAGIQYNRWYIIQRNVTQWAEEIDEVFRRYCPVSGTDLWAALSATPPTFYRSEIYGDAPYAWWPCDDQPGTSGVLPVVLLNAAIGNDNPLEIKLSPSGGAQQAYYAENGASTAEGTNSTGAPPGIAIYTCGADSGWMFGDPQSSPASLGTGNPVTANPGSAAWQASGQAGTTGSYGWYLICNDDNFPALSGGITIEAWFNAGFYGSAAGWSAFNSGGGSTTTSPVTAQPYDSPITIWEIATASAPVALLQLTSAGYLQLVTNGTANIIYTASDLRSQSWHMVTVTLTETAWAAWLDGGAGAAVSGTSSAMTSAWTYFICNGDFGAAGGTSPGSLVHGGNISLAHLAIYPVILPYYRVLDHYWAAISAFGQLPAPTGVQIAWTQGQQQNQAPGTELIGSYFVPDGSAGGTSGGYGAASGTAISVVVAASAPGNVTSGPSAWAAGTTSYHTPNAGGTGFLANVFPWISWTGVAPLFSVYTSATLGSETEAAVVSGDSDAFTGGYGAGASGSGIAQVSGGNGSSPPAAPSAIGDTVAQRIERLMRAGRCTSPNRCIDPAGLLVQAPGTGSATQVGAEIQLIQQSDSGLLYVDNCNHLTYWQRSHLASQYSSPVWHIGPTTSAGRTPYYKEAHWVTDPQRIYNVITVEPLSPTGAALPLVTPQNASAVNSSQIRYGAQPLQITSYLQSMAEMQNQADWLLSVYGSPQRHAEEVRIEAAADSAAWELVLGINVGDVVQLEDWQIGGGGTVYTLRVTEIRRRLTMGYGASGEMTGSVVLTCDFEPSSYWT